MKSYRRGLLVASLLSTGGVASAFNVTFDAGYHGAFEKIIVAEEDLSTTATSAPSSLLEGYSFVKWDVVPQTITDDLTVKAIYSKTITVDAGDKKLVSSSLVPSAENTGELEDFVTDAASYVRDEDGKFIRYIDGASVNSIGALTPGKGYLVFNDTDSVASMTITGTSFDVDRKLTLSQGYNIVPFLLEQAADPEVYLDSIISSVDYVEDLSGKRYPSGGTLLEEMEPGNAYLVKMSNAGQFVPLASVAPDETAIAPADGGTMYVTISSDDHAGVEAAAALIDDTDGVDDAELQAAWTELIHEGLSLREALWYANESSGVTGQVEKSYTITFDDALSDQTLTVNATPFTKVDDVITDPGKPVILIDNAVTVTIDGDLDDNNVADVIIREASWGGRFLEINNNSALVYINGLVMQNFVAWSRYDVSDWNVGGTVKVQNGALQLTHSTIHNSTGQSAAGAIYIAEGGSADISWSSFTECRNDWGIGAVIFNKSTNFNLSNSYFADNYVTGSTDKGVIYTSESITVSGLTFEDQDGLKPNGNAAKSMTLFTIVDGSTVTLQDSTIINNTLSSLGGSTGTLVLDKISAYGNKDTLDADLIPVGTNIDTTSIGTTIETVNGVKFIDTGSSVGAYAVVTDTK